MEMAPRAAVLCAVMTDVRWAAAVDADAAGAADAATGVRAAPIDAGGADIVIICGAADAAAGVGAGPIDAGGGGILIISGAADATAGLGAGPIDAGGGGILIIADG